MELYRVLFSGPEEPRLSSNEASFLGLIYAPVLCPAVDGGGNGTPLLLALFLAPSWYDAPLDGPFVSPIDQIIRPKAKPIAMKKTSMG